MKSLLDRGTIGRIVHVEGNYSNDYGMACEPGDYWVMKAEHPVGGMTTMGVHILDMMMNIVGPIAAVRAVSRRQMLVTEADDTTTMLFDFRRRCIRYVVDSHDHTAPLARVGIRHLGHD